MFTSIITCDHWAFPNLPTSKHFSPCQRSGSGPETDGAWCWVWGVFTSCNGHRLCRGFKHELEIHSMKGCQVHLLIHCVICALHWVSLWREQIQWTHCDTVCVAGLRLVASDWSQWEKGNNSLKVVMEILKVINKCCIVAGYNQHIVNVLYPITWCFKKFISKYTTKYDCTSFIWTSEWVPNTIYTIGLWKFHNKCTLNIMNHAVRSQRHCVSLWSAAITVNVQLWYQLGIWRWE